MAEAKGPWPHTTTYQTRWLDNDQYGHLNNSTYYLVADSIINAFLVNECGIQPFVHASSSAPSSCPSTPSEKSVSEIVGLVISNSCRYYASCSFPQPLTVGLRVVTLGKSSVTYQVSIAESRAEGREVAAVITSTHVFVDRVTRRPVQMPRRLREPLSRLLVLEEARSKL
ncbi:hypothetical protein EX895_001045 [Sporisorium graminicola]|uniref:Thioesterase domain-containing protein n=1 Tax=Sporisorium graminicola TaxID=280036 RepID=A0A4U7L2K1_9BASI|nr:hypothetical protein EX895_001045 [Sporisorium graminicola]TKY91046.1 hypothetical protein EX895_001045 [Sporisorium graminicola]